MTLLTFPGESRVQLARTAEILSVDGRPDVLCGVGALQQRDRVVACLTGFDRARRDREIEARLSERRRDGFAHARLAPVTNAAGITLQSVGDGCARSRGGWSEDGGSTSL